MMIRKHPNRLPRVCNTCLLYEGMPFMLEATTIGARRVRSFAIGEDGTCSICHEYRFLNQAVSIEARRATFEAAVPKTGGALVALSGGKDSLSTLYIVREQLGLNAEALFYDSGFLLPHIAGQVREICRRLGVVLHEVQATQEARDRIARRVENPLEPGPPACHECSSVISKKLVSMAQDRRVPAILGTNHFLLWGDDAVPAGVVQAGDIHVVSLPYLLGTTRPETLRNAAMLGATVIASPAGLSTNCRVPELVQARVGAAVGHVPEIEMLGLEVVVGHITRADAAAELVDRVKTGNLERTDWIIDAYTPIAEGVEANASRGHARGMPRKVVA